MTIKDWVELTLLIIVTLFSVERWVVTREHKEEVAADGIGKVRSDLSKDLLDHRLQQEKDFRAIWIEISRNRKHWHEDLVPWQQEVIGQLATLTEQQRSFDRQLVQLWQALERRRTERS